MKYKKIGIFDSGIGGLVVLKEIMSKYQNCEYIYFGDTKNLPYGDKTKEQLFEYSDDIIKFLISKEVDLIIIACGTISTNILDRLENNYSVKIIDIISPTIRYLKNNNYKNIGLMATNMTVKSQVFENNLGHIKSIPCPNLVPFIENNQIDSNECKKYIDNIVDQFKLNKITNIILGCTHYPLIGDILKQKYNVKYINMGKILINELNIEETIKKVELNFSKVSDILTDNVYKILGEELTINEVELN